MLIGSASLDEGSIFVHGVEMRFSTMSKIQNSLGVCLQKDLLWDRLTVQEHLELFLRLRNVALDSVESQIRSFDLVPDQIADTLSGGQKRKLCLAIALVRS
jgi:ATP-binding cassette subfamily A (ABC1) protein 3